MTSSSRAPVTAVLGPTNTGKTYLAIERMCAHSSGLIGFPLRLLAREVYDRVVAIKGVDQVALVTGEERIVPPKARWFLTTAESMPTNGINNLRDFSFVALDEAQLAADPERGHIFTDRLLNLRGRDETMLLGSATLTGALKDLVPEADIIGRPRFSTLRYAGMQKLSRLPRRSAIVAFSAEQVYAIAEMLRRLRGGAAVVMGALSPRTRNAQVAMFQSGEVDYLVATDAIGMGLNMDVDHVAFASLTKFDGRRERRLTLAEMAQIAGRAGRHQRDGTFGGVGTADSTPLFRPEEIERIEEHRFDPIGQLFWRDGDPDCTSIESLTASLERLPKHPRLRPAPEAVDLAVLRFLSGNEQVRDRARNPALVRRLWAACSLPDFQKSGAIHHASLVLTLWQYLSTGHGHIPAGWFANQIARLDNVQGDVETLAGRIAAARTWAYVAQRSDWLADPAEMAARTRALEDRLSDALHGALTQRFVDRRTTALLRDLRGDSSLLPVDVDTDGNVTVDGQTIGRLAGFRFIVDPQARVMQKRLLLAAAERRLGKVLIERAQAVLTASDGAIALVAEPGGQPLIQWEDVTLATFRPGTRLLQPELQMDTGLAELPADMQGAVKVRVEAWLDAQFARHIPALQKMDAGTRDAAVPPQVRAVLAQLADAGGIAPRDTLDATLASVEKTDRGQLRKSGVVIGVFDLYHPGLMKPGAAKWRMALLAIRTGGALVPLPPAGAVLLKADQVDDESGATIAGFRRFADVWLRIDVAERVARAGHEAIAANRPYDAADPHVVSIGLSPEAFADLMRQAGFRTVEDAAEGAPNWVFKGRPRARPARPPRERQPRSDRPARSDRPDRPDRPRGEGQQARDRAEGASDRPRKPHRKPGAPQREGRQEKPATSAPATAKALAGLADLLKRNE
jgi:ATP-dependent RNA helicase SUPV3L1/SUV3